MKVVLKKEVCGSREQYTGPIGKPSQLQKVRNALQKKKKKNANANTDVGKAISKHVLSLGGSS